MSIAHDHYGRNVVISGAGAANGIGFATARYLAERGATIFLTSLSDRVLQRVGELQARGFSAYGATCDLTNEADVQRLTNEIMAVMPRVDALVNNAGMTSVTDSSAAAESAGVGEISFESWRAALARNLDSAFLLTKNLLPALTSHNTGRIVMVASVTGPVMAMAHEAPYAAAKAGLVGLARSIALDFAPTGLTCNTVSPGWIASDSQTELEITAGKAVPMGRSGTVFEVASAISWLCHRDASYITGHNLVIDGGNSIQEMRNN